MNTPMMAFAKSSDEGGCSQSMNQNVCLQQCVGNDQSSAHLHVAVAEVPRLTALVIPVVLEHGPKLPEVVIALARSPDPPPSIRFCSFQL